MAADRTETMVALLRGLSSGDTELATGGVRPEGFVLHDPSVASGAPGLRELAGRVAGRADSLDVARTIAEDPFIVVHGQDLSRGGEVFFAVGRFEDDRVAELWRFTAPPAPPNPSGHTQTDGPTDPDGRADAAQIKALVREYYETVHIAGEHGQMDRFMSHDRQIRHEPGVRDGVEAFKRDLERLTQNRTIDEIALLVAQGDLVFIAARGTHGGDPCAYVDLYRVQAGQLVEHWGFPQPIPPRQNWRSGDGLL